MLSAVGQNWKGGPGLERRPGSLMRSFLGLITDIGSLKDKACAPKRSWYRLRSTYLVYSIILWCPFHVSYLHAPGNKSSQSLTMAYSFMPLCLYRYCLLSTEAKFSFTFSIFPYSSSRISKLLLPWATLWFPFPAHISQRRVIVPHHMMLFLEVEMLIWLMSSHPHLMLCDLGPGIA